MGQGNVIPKNAIVVDPAKPNKYAPSSPNSSSSIKFSNNNHDEVSALSSKSNAAPSSRTLVSHNSSTTIFAPPVERDLTPCSLEDYPLKSILPQVIWEGQKSCQEDPIVRKAFLDYIKGQQWMDPITPRIIELINKKIPSSELKDHITFYDYIICPRSKGTSSDPKDREEMSSKMKRCTQLKVSDSMDASTFRKLDKVQTCFNEEQLKSFLFATIWPLFVQSPENKLISPLLSDSEKEVLKQELADLTTATEGSLTPTTPSSPSLKAMDGEKLRRVKDMFYQISNAITSEEAEQMLTSGSWADAVIQAIDEIPLSVSIATADSEKRGFPLIFVNKGFERLTQYDRTEVLGRNCNVLRSAKTERDYCIKLGEVLTSGSGIKMAIMNSRKDGSDFTNFLAVRPVHDLEGNYTHVLGVQYDMSREEASLKEIKLIEDFIMIVGNLMKG